MGRFTPLMLAVSLSLSDVVAAQDAPLGIRIPEGYVPVGDIFTNSNPDFHVYTEMSKDDGLARLRELAQHSRVEEAFLHFTDGSNSYWFETGFNEKERTTNVSTDILERLVRDRAGIVVTEYHLHTNYSFQQEISVRDPLSIEGRISPTPDERLEIPSSNDIIRHAQLKSAVRTMNPSVQFNSGVVSARGVYYYDLNGELERKILQKGFSRAKTFVEILCNIYISPYDYSTPGPRKIASEDDQMKRYYDALKGKGITITFVPLYEPADLKSKGE